MSTSETSRLKLKQPDPVSGLVLVSELNDNTNILDANPGVFICTSTTRPSAPFEGQHIYETDTENHMVRVGSAWEFLSSTSAPYRVATGIVTVAVNNSNSGTGAISFPAGRFSVAPVLTLGVNNGGATWLAFFSNINAGGATCVVRHYLNTGGQTANVPVNWHAIQMTSTSGEG